MRSLLPIRPALLLGALLALAASVSAQTTWTGALDSAWDQPSNWSAGVPNAAVSATIPSGTTNSPSTAGVGSAATLDLTLATGATLTVDVDTPIEIGGNATLDGALAGGGVVVLVGPGTLSAGASTSLPNLEIAAGVADTVIVSGAVDVAGDLTVSNGVATLATGATLTVGGNAVFSGGALAGGATTLIDVAGDVTFSGTTSTAPPDFDVAGDWTADAGATFAAGLVTFDGGGVTQVVSAASGAFFDVTLGPGALLDTTGLDMPIGGSLIMEAGSGWTLVSVILLIGATQELDPGGDLPNVDIGSPGSVNVRDGVTIDGSVSLLYGKMCIDDTAEVTVGGDADFSGGTLTGETPDAILDIAGDVSWTGATANNPPVLSVGGDWSSNGSFTPNGNVVEFDGGATSDVFSDGSVFFDVRVLRSTTVDVTSARLELQGDLTVPAAGGFTTASTLRFVGATQTVAPGGPLPNVEVAGTSVTFTAAPQAVDGDLTLLSGTLTVDASAEIDVAGDGSFQGGVLASGAGGRLDVEGSCSFTGTTGTTPPDIDCAGDWTSDAAFAPTSGVVTLDGTADTIFDTFGPGFDPSFFTVRFTNGRRVVGQDLTLNADTIRVAAGGELDLNGNRVVIPGTIVDIAGRLDIDTSAELQLGGGVDMAVTQTGELSMVGLDTAPARITGFNGGGYQLMIDGLVTACGFAFAEMGPMGVVMSNTTRFSEPPFDMRNGAFTRPSPVPGSVLLDIEQVEDREFSRLTFDDPLGVGTFNVRSVASAPITFVNYDGNFGGPQFEDVLNPGTIAWILNATTQLTASPQTSDGEGKTTIAWQTQLEVDAEAFVVDAGPSPAGPWTPIGETPALGSGSAYALDHFAPLSTQTCYRLSERLFHSGDVQPLGVVCTFAGTDPNPSNVLTVSPFGKYPTIAAALADVVAGVAGPVADIRVASGTYPPFAVDLAQLGVQTLQIGALGNGPVVIDTAAGPTLISNVPPTANVFLTGLTFGSPNVAAGGGTALVLEACDGIVVLDSLTVTGAPIGPSIFANDARRLLVQNTTATNGGPDLALEGVTTAIVTRGTIEVIDAAGQTDLRTCEVNGTVLVNGAATAITFAGRMPRAAPPSSFLQVTEPFELLVDGDVGASPLLRIDFGLAWFDPIKPKWQLISLVPFPAAVEINLPPLGAAPTSVPFVIPPIFQNQLLGLSLQVQPVTVQPAGTVRFGHVTRLTFTL